MKKATAQPFPVLITPMGQVQPQSAEEMQQILAETDRYNDLFYEAFEALHGDDDPDPSELNMNYIDFNCGKD